MTNEDDIDFSTDQSDKNPEDELLGTDIDSSKINSDQPDFLKNIKSKHTDIPFPLETEFIPKNPYTLNGNEVSYTSGGAVEGLQKKSGFFETAGAEAYNFNASLQAIHAGYDESQKPNPLDDIPSADWSPKTDQDKFLNVKPENLAYILDATGPKDQSYRLERVYEEQAHNDTLANGSFVAKLLGGAVGIVTDPMSYIPIVGWAKYAKVGAGFLRNTARALPGVAAYSVLNSAAEQADKVNGNMVDFLTDSFTNTVFGTVLFGAAGELAPSIDKLELWNLKSFAKNYVDGIDYKLNTNEKGIITGYKAVDTTGNLSSAKISFAQDIANSSFDKSGLFKIPYLGEGALKLFSMPVFGSPLPRLLNSPFPTVRAVIDRVADHSILTKGVREGQVAPKKFASEMNQTFAKLRALSVQMTGLHTERNGFNIKERHMNGLVNLGLNIQDKSLKIFAKDLDKSGYISRSDFDAEVQEVISSANPSEHASVNVAAAMMRETMDGAYRSFREAYGLPKDWLPPRTQNGFLTRVYDTPFLNTNEEKWNSVISQELKNQDEAIQSFMEPVNTANANIEQHEFDHKALIERPNVTDKEIKKSSNELIAKKSSRKSLIEQLQNDIRENPDMNLLVHDWNALSANEANEIEKLNKRVAINEKEVEKHRAIVKAIKTQSSQRKTASMKSKTAKTAKGNARKSAVGDLVLEKAQADLEIAERELEDEKINLQDKLHSGEVDSRLYYQEKGSNQRFLKDPANRLKFREQYESDFHRRSAAKAYYDTILNQTAEDTINQVMGRFTGNGRENPIKQRTLLIPDSILYQNKFLTNDLMAKVSNYVSYLDRRKHLKNVFNDVTIEGGFEPIIENLNKDHENFRAPLNARKTELEDILAKRDQPDTQLRKAEKQLKTIDKQLVKHRKQFDTAKKDLNHLYDKMMGIMKVTRTAQKLKASIMSITSWSSLPFVPLTMINDVSAIGLQHGIWPFIRDGLYPLINSLGGFLKTKDSEAFRKTAPSILLALQDVQMGYADRNWGNQTNPYLNMGKIVNSLQHIAHASANFTLTNYIDNGLQRLSASVFQSNLMSILHDFKAGKMSERDGRYIRKYGIAPEKWADRMISAFKQDGGGKTKIGGYQSLFYQWQDIEAANEFGDAVFRSVKDTNINASIADSPFWTDDDGPIGVMGGILKGFNGWGYASINRYVIPSLQAPDAQKLLGVMWMLGTGAMVDPMRRMARGEQPYPDNITDQEMLWSTINNSGYFSFFANVLEDANVLSGDNFLGNLKNDKYRDRTRVGLLGPAWGKANQLADVISALGTNEWNKADANKAIRMVPFANASWTYWMSNHVINSLDIPNNRSQARALKGAG